MSEPLGGVDADVVFSVEHLLKYMGNTEKAQRIVSKIVRDACAPGTQPIITATTAMSEGRNDDAAEIFHGLRGSVGALGAKRFVRAAQAFEHGLTNRDHTNLPALLASACGEYLLVLEQANDWLAQHQPSDSPGAPA